MAIIKEYYKTRKDGVMLFKTYSTNGFKIRKIGTDEIYDQAIDIALNKHIYEETSEKIEEK